MKRNKGKETDKQNPRQIAKTTAKEQQQQHNTHTHTHTHRKKKKREREKKIREQTKEFKTENSQ